MPRIASRLFLATLLLSTAACHSRHHASRAATPRPAKAMRIGTAFSKPAVARTSPKKGFIDIPGAVAAMPWIGMAVPDGESCGPSPNLPGFPGIPGLPNIFPFPPAPQPGPTPPSPPPTQPGADNWPADWAAFETEVLAETNRRRAAGAICGGQPKPPVGPLTLQAQLRTAARHHSRDMATRGYFDHTTPEGLGPGQRAQAAGFPHGSVAENIAAGARTPAEVVQGWMDSPGHCHGIMDGGSTIIGIGYYLNEQDSQGYRTYWTQKFSS